MKAADWIAFASLVIAAGAFVASLYAIYKANRYSSVATLVTIHEVSEAAWQSFLTKQSLEEKRKNLCVVMNWLEIASAILNERSSAGVSKDVLRDYLTEQLSLLFNDPQAREFIPKMFSSKKTFEHIKKFCKAEHIHIPVEWSGS